MISPAQRLRIIELHYGGMGATPISQEVGVIRANVYRLIELYRNSGSIEHAPIPGRPRVTTPEGDNAISAAAEDTTHTTRALRARLEFSGPRPSISTIYRRVRRRGLYSGIQRRKDARLQDPDIQNERYGWACETLAEWTAFSCSTRIYVDDCTINSCSSYRRREWRRRGSQQRRGWQFVRGSGWTSVSVFGGIVGNELLPLYICRGGFTGKQYVNVLENIYWPASQENFEARPFVLQQDNTPSHTSRIVRNYVETVPELERGWVYQPPNSPDLNPIENVWARLKRLLRDRDLPNRATLLQAVQETWQLINEDKEFLHSLTLSMPDRLQAVIDASGGPTRY